MRRKVMATMADEFSLIVDELVAQLKADIKHGNAPTLKRLDDRLEQVRRDAAAGEVWAKRRSLIEVAAKALHIAKVETPDDH
jgi:hypothetical protein